MEKYDNSAKIYTGTSCGELKISVNNTKQIISATNNRAKYYSDLAEKYKDEAKEYRDNAQYYAEQNSDVTYSYIDSVKNELNEKINQKQDSGDYALKSEIPLNVSELINDMEYTTFDSVIPEQTGKEKQVLYTDGENLYWDTPSSYCLFDTKMSDHILSYDESKGWALQGTYVYKEAIAGSRYGYPDFYNKCLEEKEAGTVTEVTLGDSIITIYVNSNGHQFYDIADKEAVDSWFDTYGSAWVYGIDTENERIFLPRNIYFEQATGDVLEVGQSVEAGLPNITGGFILGDGTNAGALCTRPTGAFGNSTLTWAYSGRSGTATNTFGVNFDASRSNDIYGNSDTVQPNAVKKLLYICVGNTTNFSGITEVVNQGMDLVEQVNLGLESRLNTDITNISADGKNSIIALNSPDYENGIGMHISSNSFTYTCPSNGMIAVKLFGSPMTDVSVNINGQPAIIGNSGASAINTQLTGTTFVSKADVVSVSNGTSYSSSSSSVHYMYFYPLKGAN